jgi:hypothetical protein
MLDWAEDAMAGLLKLLLTTDSSLPHFPSQVLLTFATPVLKQVTSFETL